MPDGPENVSPEVLAAFLQRILDYPFDPSIDQDFVEELLGDFAALDVLEEVKAFRWFSDSWQVAKSKHVRLSLSRWLSGTIHRRMRSDRQRPAAGQPLGLLPILAPLPPMAARRAVEQRGAEGHAQLDGASTVISSPGSRMGL